MSVRSASRALDKRAAFLFLSAIVPVIAISTARADVNAHADSDTDAKSYLDEVVVSGSRTATALSLTPAAISVVGHEALERDKPKTMGDVLNRVAGVSWNDLGNEQHSMGIRQPNSTNSVYQYLEDGIPIRPLGVFNHNSLNELNLSGSDSVELVKGPASSLYGSNAVGGAINFITAEPSDSLYANIGVRHEAVTGYDRYDTGLSDTFGKFGFRLSHYSARRDRNNWQEYSYGNKDSVTLRMDYALSATSKLRSTFVYSNLDSAMTGSLFTNDYLTNPGKSINTFTYRKDKSLRATLAWQFKPTDHGDTTLTAFWRKNDHGQLPSYTITGCSGANCRGTINNNHVDSVGLDAKHVQEFSWLQSRLIAGIYLDSSKNPYISNNLAIVRNTTTGRYVSYTLDNITSAVGVRDYETKIFNYAPFVQYELTPVNKMRVVLGGRYDAIRYQFTNHLTPGASFGAPNESRTFAHFSPKIGATYSFTNTLNSYVNISEGFTAPDVSQLYGKAAIPDLHPATYRNYELGLRNSLFNDALRLEAAVYRLTGKDTILSYTISPGNSINQNAGRTRSQGMEFSAQLNMKQFDARLATSISSHRYVNYAVSGTANYDGKEMPQAPDATTAEIGYTPITSLRIAVEGIHQSSSWMNNADTVRYHGHTLVNARINYEIHQFTLWAQGRNLGNARYSDSSSSSYSGAGAYNPNTQDQYTPGAPRSVMLGLTWTFGKTQ